jgi:hypothetical protein
MIQTGKDEDNMRIILLTKQHFAELVSKHNLSICTVGNLPTPTLIDPLRDVAYMISEEVQVVDCATVAFEMSLNGRPLSLYSLARYANDKVESDRLEIANG